MEDEPQDQTASVGAAVSAVSSSDAEDEDVSSVEGWSASDGGEEEKAHEDPVLRPPAPRPFDPDSKAARDRRQMCLSRADTAAELASLNEANLQSIRLNELRVCFQLSNAKLGLPYVPTELLEIVNGYCAPSDADECPPVVTVVHCRSTDDACGHERTTYSEAVFRRMVREELRLVSKFMRWRQIAWAHWQETVDADADNTMSDRSARITEESSAEDSMTVAGFCAVIRELLSNRRDLSRVRLNGPDFARRWNRAFHGAFFNRPENFSSRNGSCPMSMQLRAWIEGRRRAQAQDWILAAEDPHCDIEQLASIYDDFSTLEGDHSSTLIVYADGKHSFLC